MKILNPETNKISKAYIATLLPVHPTILEAGAHIGRDTIKMIKQWPQATIYAFEPVPSLYAQLSNRIRPYKNIYSLPYALSDTQGAARLHISSGRSNACSSLLTPHKLSSDVLFTQQITVSATTIDQWALTQKIAPIDFIWLDLQGAELQALKHATEVLKHVSVIQVEINKTERYHGAPRHTQLRAYLEERGFCCLVETFYKTDWGDALYVADRKAHHITT